MVKLPKAIRFFRKPDHISFLVAYALILVYSGIPIFEIKIASTIAFVFTLGYELFEISKGNRDIQKIDHYTFVIGLIILFTSFWYEEIFLLVIIDILFGFTLIYEIYRVRKMDLINKRKNNKN